jgi:D-lactate dehydrogenase
MFGAQQDGHGEAVGVTTALSRLIERAGLHVLVPRGIESVCCGTPWSSKGFAGGREAMGRRVVELVRDAVGDRDIPVISDATSCTEGFAALLSAEGFRVEDALTFARRELLPRLRPEVTIDTLTLHPTCSSHQLGIDDDLLAIGAAVATSVVVPQDWGCCGFAGDRGMLHPELTAAATAPEAAAVAAIDGDAHASCNRTCELGLARATGRPYRHVLELLEAATRSAGA